MRGKQIYGVPDEENPEWTAADFAAAKPFAEVFPDLAAKEIARRRRGPQKAPTKRLISLRLDVEVVQKFRATGAGWQARMNATLAAHAPRRKGSRTSRPKSDKRRRVRRPS
jgi:uncharacterized protein (DUF4415 family)